MKALIYIPLFIGVFLNASAQLLLKAGLDRIGHFEFAVKNIWPIGLQIAVNPYIILGLSFYVFSLIAWLIGLSRVDVSIAYPLLSLGYIYTAVLSYFILNENISLLRIAGILVILLGVFLITRSV